jgi:hypothetical protein
MAESATKRPFFERDVVLGEAVLGDAVLNFAVNMMFQG